MLPGTVSNFQLYERNKGYVYRYTNDCSKMVICRAVRKCGYEEAGNFTPKGKAGNTSKLGRSLARTKSTIAELAICNPWNYFVTLTLNQNNVHDRYDLDGCVKRFSKWLNNYKTRHPDADVAYLIIPEQHKDGAWHFHGLIRGIPAEDLHQFRLAERNLPARIRDQLNQGKTVYKWIPYDRSFGYCTLSPVRSLQAVSKYITKYITKELGQSVSELNAHLFYASHGLNRRELVMSAPGCYMDSADADWVGEYAMVKSGQTPADFLQYFPDSGSYSPLPDDTWRCSA